MIADALGRRVVSLSAAVALATGCGRPAMPPQDPSTMRAPAEGIPDAQATQAPAPDAQATQAPAPDAQATQAPAPSPSGPSTATTDGTDSGRDPHRMRRMLGWISFAIGAEAAGVAVATSLLLEHQKSIRDNGCVNKVCNPDGIAAVNTIDTIVPWNTGSWFVAAAGLGAGIVLLIASPPQHERQTAITLSPVSSGFDLGVRSTF